MAVPKSKVSRTRRDKRRGSNWKLTAPALVKCPQILTFFLMLSELELFLQ